MKNKINMIRQTALESMRPTVITEAVKIKAIKKARVTESLNTPDNLPPILRRLIDRINNSGVGKIENVKLVDGPSDVEIFSNATPEDCEAGYWVGDGMLTNENGHLRLQRLIQREEKQWIGSSYDTYTIYESYFGDFLVSLRFEDSPGSDEQKFIFYALEIQNLT